MTAIFDHLIGWYNVTLLVPADLVIARMRTTISSLTFTSNRSFLGVALSSKVNQGNEIEEPGERHNFCNIRARSELLGNWEEDVSGLLRAPSCWFGNTLPFVD